MVLLVPPPTDPGGGDTTSIPTFRVRFHTPTGVVDMAAQALTADTTIGRTSSRTDGAGTGSGKLTFDDTARTLDPDFASSPLNGQLIPGGTTTVILDCNVPGNGFVGIYGGAIDGITSTWDSGPVWSQATVDLVDPQQDLTRHIQAAGVIYPFQQTGTRIAALLGATARSGWGWINRAPTNAFVIESGQKVLGPLTTDGTTDTWGYVADAAAAEAGLAFFDQRAVPTFHDQDHRSRQTVPAWVFGENTGELHYESSIEMDLTNDRVTTDIAYDTADGITSGYGPGGVFSWVTGTDQTGKPRAQATTSSTPLCDMFDGASRARSEYRRFSVNRREIPTIEIDAFADWATVSSALASNRAWCAVTAQIGDLVTVNRRPAGTAISKQFYIDAISHTITPQSWITRFSLVPVETAVAGWVLGVDKLGSFHLTW